MTILARQCETSLLAFIHTVQLLLVDEGVSWKQNIPTISMVYPQTLLLPLDSLEVGEILPAHWPVKEGRDKLNQRQFTHNTGMENC